MKRVIDTEAYETVFTLEVNGKKVTSRDFAKIWDLIEYYQSMGYDKFKFSNEFRVKKEAV